MADDMLLLKEIARTLYSAIPKGVSDFFYLIIIRLVFPTCSARLGAHVVLRKIRSYKIGRGVGIGSATIEPYAQIGDFSALADAMITSSKQNPTIIGKWCVWGGANN